MSDHGGSRLLEVRHLEAWLPIVGYEGLYEVSDRGRMFSLGGRRGSRGGLLRLAPDRGGYMQVGLHGRGRSRVVKVHRLVLQAFVGPCPAGQLCRHLNDIPSDNRWPENICWGTPEENQADRIRLGRGNGGQRNGQAKLTASDVRELRALRHAGASAAELAARFEVHPTTVHQITRGATWRYAQ